MINDLSKTLLVALVTSVASATALAAEKALDNNEFVMKAGQGGMVEVKLGELAAQKAEHAEVKKFGEMMAKNHSMANEDLKKIVSDKKMTLPAELDKEHQMTVDKFSKLSGKEFDKAYVAEMIKDHKKDIALFEKASKGLEDTELRAFAARTLPILRTHLETIQGIKNEKK